MFYVSDYDYNCNSVASENQPLPFPPSVKDGVLKGGSNFWMCG